MTPFIPTLLLKATVIFAVGLVVSAAMRTVSSSIRHLVLLAALVCGLTLPALMLVSPRWDVRVLPRSSASLIPGESQRLPAPYPSGPSVGAPAAPATNAQNAVDAVTPPSAVVETRTPAVLNLEAAPGLAWGIGCIAVLAWLAIGRLRLRKIVREAWPLGDVDWRRNLEQARAEADVTREVRLFTSSVVTTPLTWGTLRPVILLPEDALDWDDDHRRVVLRHEMAHVSRADSLSQLLAGLVCAFYWFHPLAWMLERRLRAECERACDDRVVILGTPATDYASHLLEVARSARSFGAPGFLSVAMARPSQLEGRLLAVLNESRERVAASRTSRLIAIAISLLVMLPLAAFRPVERSTLSPQVAAPTPASGKREFPTTATTIAGKNYSTENISRKAGRRFDSTFTLSAPLRSGGTLYIDLKTGGGITIESWDKPEVFVNARLSGRSWRDTRVTLEPSGGNATLASDFTRDSRNQSSSHDFDIKLPRQVKVKISSAGGDVDISNISGDFSGETGGGEIKIRQVNGRIDLSTGGGEVLVQDSNLDGTVSTGGGVVRVFRVNGHFRGSSGSGPVIYADAAGAGKGYGYGTGEGAATMATVDGDTTGYAIATGGPIRMSAAGGSLKLPFAPNGARVSTGGGKVTIGPSGGAVYAETGGGDIEIGPARGSVEAHTGAGSVDVDFRGKGSLDVTSGTGRVVINVPDDLNANLELETAYTDNFRGKPRIVSDWPLNVTETSNWDVSHGTPRRYIRVRQQVGRGGPLIKINTVNGDIVLRKGS